MGLGPWAYQSPNQGQRAPNRAADPHRQALKAQNMSKRPQNGPQITRGRPNRALEIGPRTPRERPPRRQAQKAQNQGLGSPEEGPIGPRIPREGPQIRSEISKSSPKGPIGPRIPTERPKIRSKSPKLSLAPTETGPKGPKSGPKGPKSGLRSAEKGLNRA